MNQPDKTTVLYVPFDDKEKAKALGAKWDTEGKTWYAPAGIDLVPLKQWSYEQWLKSMKGQAQGQPQAQAKLAPEGKKTILNVPFENKDQVKKLGARWDTEGKTWYAPAGADLVPFEQWLKPSVNLPASNLTPEAEFLGACQAAGLNIKSAIMDGELHRVPVQGDHGGQTGGAYTGYLDGFPAGFIQNWKTGFKENWRYSGQRLDAASIKQMQTQITEQKAVRDADRQRKYNIAANEITAELQGLKPAPQDHPYLVNHGIEPSAKNNSFGALVDKDNNLVIPLQDPAGKVWSAQRISTEGFKSFKKESVSDGMYHKIIGVSSLEGKPVPVLVTSGFGTGAALSAATGFEVVCAMSDYNLKNAAETIHKQQPNRKIIVMGDIDIPGHIGAEAAAKAIGTKAWYPHFSEKDTQSTDFADLAVEKGLKEVNRQCQQAMRALQKTNARPANLRKITPPTVVLAQAR